jgi:TM2 domain-containing membrane protein YozV
MNCTRCGSEIPPGDSVCGQCGRKLYFTGDAPYYSMASGTSSVVGTVIEPSDPPKKAFIALLLSMVVVGVGQMYLGQVFKGLSIFIAAVMMAIVTMGVAALAVWIVAMIDAYIIGKKLERGQPVRRWEWF